MRMPNRQRLFSLPNRVAIYMLCPTGNLYTLGGEIADVDPVRSVRHLATPLPTGHRDRPPNGGGAHGHLELETAAVAHAAHAWPYAVAHAPHYRRRHCTRVVIAAEEVPPARGREAGSAHSAQAPARRRSRLPVAPKRRGRSRVLLSSSSRPQR